MALESDAPFLIARLKLENDALRNECAHWELLHARRLEERKPMEQELEHRMDGWTAALDQLNKFKRGLAAAYRMEPVTVADLCDEHIDPSGRLLGEVRNLAD